jgi:hypothetical protein
MVSGFNGIRHVLIRPFSYQVVYGLKGDLIQIFAIVNVCKHVEVAFDSPFAAYPRTKQRQRRHMIPIRNISKVVSQLCAVVGSFRIDRQSHNTTRLDC